MVCELRRPRGEANPFQHADHGKQTAQTLLGKRKTDDARRREGITDASTERLAKAERSPISVHLDAYLQSLISAGRSQGHIDRQRDRITIIVDGAGFSRLSDITPPEIQKVVNNIRTGKSQKLVAAGTEAIERMAAMISGTCPEAAAAITGKVATAASVAR